MVGDEECDDGNDIDDDGCSNDCTIPQGFDGCTPGFWKNNVGQWAPTPYSPGQSLNGVFSEASAFFPNHRTLLQALNFGGGSGAHGGAKILLRAAVAGLLNASHPDVGYAGADAASLIAAVNAALASGDRATMLALAGSIDFDNNAGCSLDADESNGNRRLPGARVPTRFNAPSISTSDGTVDFGRR